MKKKQESGVALITALLIVSLATIMAVSLISRQYMDIRRTGNIMSSDKAYLQALTMETSAMHLLRFSRDTLQKKYDDKNDFDQAVLGLNASAMKVSEGEASVSLVLGYPEGLFNVNTLIDKDGKVRPKRKQWFGNLVKSVLRDIDEPTSLADELVDSLLDWIDEDQDNRPYGAEDGTYESKTPPYKAANQLLASVSELQLIEGYEQKILYGIPKDQDDEDSVAIPGLLNYVTALPDIDSTININLISAPKIIQSLSIYITDTMANDIIASQPFKDIGEFESHIAWDAIKTSDASGGGKNYKDVKDNLKLAKSMLDVQSSYFVAKSTATLGSSVYKLNSLVYVSTSGGKLSVISRAIGTDGI